MKPSEHEGRTSCCGPAAAEQSCCAAVAQASRQAGEPQHRDEPWMAGDVMTPVGPIPRVTSSWSPADRLGAVRVRLSIGRMDYAVTPGLYAMGNPSPDAPVFVSANYKLSFDHLRRELGGIDGWILVLDTKGINVWCAAGKGTFGTGELIERIQRADLKKVVSHRTLILPQLGAPGVAAHEVRKQCGFRVVYGPVRAHDIPAFLAAGMIANPEMRRVVFDLPARLVVIPVEMVMWFRYALLLAVGLVLLAGLHRAGYDPRLALEHGLPAAGYVLLAYLGGLVLAPVLLPWLPGRAFATKGAIVGLILAICTLVLGSVPWSQSGGRLTAAGWLFMMPAISSFLTMNYTGTSTYTSLSGVKLEMRYAIPLQVGAGIMGLGCWVAGSFLRVP